MRKATEACFVICAGFALSTAPWIAPALAGQVYESSSRFSRNETIAALRQFQGPCVLKVTDRRALLVSRIASVDSECVNLSAPPPFPSERIPVWQVERVQTLEAAARRARIQRIAVGLLGIGIGVSAAVLVKEQKQTEYTPEPGYVDRSSELLGIGKHDSGRDVLVGLGVGLAAVSAIVLVLPSPVERAAALWKRSALE